MANDRCSAKDGTPAPDAAIDAFLDDVLAVYRKHGMALSPEDPEDAFNVVRLDDYYIQLLLPAGNNLED
jgi:hypothetical protein